MATRQAVHRRIWRFLTVSIVSIFIQCDLPLYHHEQAAEAAHLNIEPRLRIKSAFAGTVWDLDIDPSETFITVPNAAKSVTVWPIDNDKQSQLLRVPLRNEEATKARPSAISPDFHPDCLRSPDGGRCPSTSSTGNGLNLYSRAYFVSRDPHDKRLRCDNINSCDAIALFPGRPLSGCRTEWRLRHQNLVELQPGT